MRTTIGVMLAVLITPLAQAELIDDIADRGELRIAVQADNSPYAFKENDHLAASRSTSARRWPRNWTCAPNSSKPLPLRCCRVSRLASTTSH